MRPEAQAMLDGIVAELDGLLRQLTRYLPRIPDISIGKVFDTSWEVISFMIPMWIVRPILENRFRRRIQGEVHKNLSRLTTQWEERIHAAISEAAKEAGRRLEEIIATTKRLLLAKTLRVNQIRARI